MKKVLLLSLLALTGCAAHPVIKETFPDPPIGIVQKCPDLATVDNEDTAQVSDILSVVTMNYTRYYICAAVVDAWQSWYNSQKVNFDSLHKPK
jgi:hypothetical protein